MRGSSAHPSNIYPGSYKFGNNVYKYLIEPIEERPHAHRVTDRFVELVGVLTGAFRGCFICLTSSQISCSITCSGRITYFSATSTVYSSSACFPFPSCSSRLLKNFFTHKLNSLHYRIGVKSSSLSWKTHKIVDPRWTTIVKPRKIPAIVGLAKASMNGPPSRNSVRRGLFAKSQPAS